jgi:membrane-associated phospholipid phosphatase
MLLAAAGCVLAFAVLAAVMHVSARAQRLDFAALDGFATLEREPFTSVAQSLAHLFNPGSYALMVAALLAWAVARRGPRYAGAALLLLAGANLSTLVLKPLLANPRNVLGFPSLGWISPEAFPSGHSTASMALALAAVLVAPRAYRPLVGVLGLLVALAVGTSLLVLDWHYPSDVLGGQLVAAAWALTALAALRVAAERWPERGSMRTAARAAVPAPSAATLARIGLGAGAVVVLALIARADTLAYWAHHHTAALAAGVAIAASGAALVAAVTALAVRRG